MIGILTVFAVATLVQPRPDLLAFSGYPSFSDIVASVALTFFAFLGFGVVTFTAKDLADPARQLPRAMFLALGMATVVYVAVALGVFGTLTVDEVIDSGGTALAVAAEPVLGRAGYWMMTRSLTINSKPSAFVQRRTCRARSSNSRSFNFLRNGMRCALPAPASRMVHSREPAHKAPVTENLNGAIGELLPCGCSRDVRPFEGVTAIAELLERPADFGAVKFAVLFEAA